MADRNQRHTNGTRCSYPKRPTDSRTQGSRPVDSSGSVETLAMSLRRCPDLQTHRARVSGTIRKSLTVCLVVRQHERVPVLCSGVLQACRILHAVEKGDLCFAVRCVEDLDTGLHVFVQQQTVAAADTEPMVCAPKDPKTM